jgi:hypothetical protein
VVVGPTEQVADCYATADDQSPDGRYELLVAVSECAVAKERSLSARVRMA